MASASSAAHVSQFLPNLPVLKDGPKIWPALKGPMRLTFFTHAALTLVNLAAMALVRVG